MFIYELKNALELEYKLVLFYAYRNSQDYESKFRVRFIIESFFFRLLTKLFY